MSKRSPVRVNKETHLKVIILLLIIAMSLFVASRCLGRDEEVDRPVSLVANSTPIRNASSQNEGAIADLELPRCEDVRFMVRQEQGRYTLYYDTLACQARWVAYLLTRDEVKTTGVARKNNFRSDPQLLSYGWPVARDRDYVRSGYDRGHLLPSADRDDTSAENSATFLLSNISPQRPALNRGLWKQLEEQVRRWAVQYDSLYIVTGGVLENDLPTLPAGIAIPRYFYKAILVRHNNHYQAIGFLMPNAERIEGSWSDYALAVDSIEKRTELDLFYLLPDAQEITVEAVWNSEFWR